MLRKFLCVLALCAAAGSSAGQSPIYKLLYSAPNPSSQGSAPLTVFEVSPGLLYFLSTAQAQSAGGVPSFGPSIFSLAITGSPILIYSFPFNNLSRALVQAADGRLYGAVYTAQEKGIYYSILPSGDGLKPYPTGAWSSIWAITVMPGGIYDAIGTVSQS
jgi:hypothetical protein